jgi:hypothetical protein
MRQRLPASFADWDPRRGVRAPDFLRHQPIVEDHVGILQRTQRIERQ